MKHKEREAESTVPADRKIDRPTETRERQKESEYNPIGPEETRREIEFNGKLNKFNKKKINRGKLLTGMT